MSQLATDIARLNRLDSAVLWETGAAELTGALCGEDDDDRAYRAELEKLAR